MTIYSPGRHSQVVMADVSFMFPVYGGEITGQRGQIASPLYPNKYPHSVDYTWTITVPLNMFVYVTFNDIDIEAASSGCIYDYVRVKLVLYITSVVQNLFHNLSGYNFQHFQRIIMSCS